METLHDIGEKYGTDKAWRHQFLDFYEANLPGRDFNGRLLEIGYYEGASLRMWREYYPHAEIVGIDVVDEFPNVEGVWVEKMDATDLVALTRLGSFDIIVDDGSHMTKDQQISFLWLYHHQLNENGLYIMEDLHTSDSPEHINSRFTTELLLNNPYKSEIYQTKPGSKTAIISGGQRGLS